MNKVINILLLFIPIFSFGQWTQMGDELNGSIGQFKTTAISGNGNRLAVGDAGSNVTSMWGYTKTFEWDGSNWVSIGDVFLGSEELEGTGASVSFDKSGNTLAIGSSHALNNMGWRTGGVRVFDWINGEWVQRGLLIEGEGDPHPFHQTDSFGESVSLSSDGNIIAIGGYGNTLEVGLLHYQGHVRIYEWTGTAWVMKGDEINGETGLEQFGFHVSINGSGDVVVIGGPDHWNADTTATPGYVQVHAWDGQAWIQLGEDLEGVNPFGSYGSSVDIDEEGNTIIISGKQGIVEVHDWNGAEWIQRGDLSQQENTFLASTVEINDSGEIILIGEPWANFIAGRARVLEWDDNNWEPIGNSINGTVSATIEALGTSIAMNSAGSRIVAGGFGKIKVFENSTIVSLKDLEEQDIKIQVYPNPTHGILNLSNLQNVKDIQVSSMSGKVLIYQKIDDNNTNQIKLDITWLPSGVYLLEVISLDQLKTFKIQIY